MFSVPAEPYEIDEEVVKHAEPAAHPARRSRAELHHVDGAPGRQLAGEPVRLDRGRHLRALGPAARRRQPRGPRDARADPGRRRRRRRSTSSWPRTRTPASASWASATASTRTTTRARRSSRPPADKVLAKLGINDPLLDIAQQLEEAALTDPYFVERKLYPNVDFYSGIIYRALGIPTNMFTVMFALGRLPGWIAHWKEMIESRRQDRPPAPDLHRAPPRPTTSRSISARRGGRRRLRARRPRRRSLLAVMDKKDHWAWKHFTGPGLTKEQLTVHFGTSSDLRSGFPGAPRARARPGPASTTCAPRSRATSTRSRPGTIRSAFRTPSSSSQMMDGLGIARDEVVRGPLEPRGARVPRPSRRVQRLAAVVRGRRGGDHLRRGERARTSRATGRPLERPIEEAIAGAPHGAVLRLPARCDAPRAGPPGGRGRPSQRRLGHALYGQHPGRCRGGRSGGPRRVDTSPPSVACATATASRGPWASGHAP